VAYTLVDIDGSVTPALTDALEAIDGVLSVRAVAGDASA
jgi:hypothetical protein